MGSPAGGDSGRALFAHFLLIATVGVFLYADTLDAPFQFDDRGYICENPLVRDPSCLLEPGAGGSGNLSRNVRRSFQTRYLGYLSFSLNHALGGMNVAGYHATNLILHVLNAWLVLLLVRGLLGTPLMRGSPLQRGASGVAMAAALLFVAHPVQTEAVTYLSQRFTILATFFYLLSLVLYLHFRLRDAWWGYAGALGAAVCAMFSKEMAFTLPVTAALMEFMFFRGPVLRRLVMLVPLGLTMSLVPLSLLDWDKPFSEAVDEATRTSAAYTRLEYLTTQFRVLVTCLRLLVLPVNQNLDYDYPLWESFLSLQVLGSFLLLMGAAALAGDLVWRCGRGRPGWRMTAFGIFWFVLTVSVESSLVVLDDLMFEHRLYLPSVGVLAAAVVAGAQVMEGGGNRPLLARTALFLLVFWLSVATVHRNHIWDGDIRLWEDVVRKSPLKVRPHNNLGVAYSDAGMHEDALRHYLVAVRLRPGAATAHYNVGNAYRQMGRLGLARAAYERALEISPMLSEAHNGLGLVAYALGDLDRAVAKYRDALHYEPEDAVAHFNLGIAYTALGDFDRAVSHYQTALSLNRFYLEACFNLALLYYEHGREEDARRHFRRVLELRPGFPPALKYLDLLRS